MSSVNPALCGDDAPRRAALRLSPLTGLDYLEVDETDRRKLKVVFIARLSASLSASLTAANFVVRGGRRTRNLKVVHAEVCAPADQELDDCVTVTVDQIGDFSTYTLCVVEAENNHPTDRPHAAFDPRYACLDFTFTAGCPADVDCLQPQVCPPPERPKPPIDYLAKDYASFKQLMLDRLAVLIPGWTERHEPDLLLTLVELLAYEGDRLSYLQDAVATEAYLNTARQRVSVRRHARLVDYHLHEGSNARAWVFVDTAQDTRAFSLDEFFFTTPIPGIAAGTVLSPAALSSVADDAYEVFEPLAEPAANQFTRRSLRDPARLCRRLLAASDPVARFLRDRLVPEVRAELEAWNGVGDPPLALVDDVLAELNRLAGEQTLYDEKSLVAGHLSAAARQMLHKPVAGQMQALNQAVLSQALQSELSPAGALRFTVAHNRIRLYTWGERECCLPKGATTASLLDACPDETPNPSPPSPAGKPATPQLGPAIQQPPPTQTPSQTQPPRCLSLSAGDYLLFEEVLGPHTNRPEDADPAHRVVVRLVRVETVVDPVLGHNVLEVEWAPADALPFPVCISAIGPAPDCDLIEDITVVRGNIVLVDHGRRVVDELPPVEVDEIVQPCEDDCRPEAQLQPAAYHPNLSRRDLTYAVPLVPEAPAVAQMHPDPQQALPAICLTQIALALPNICSPDPLARYRAPLPLTAFDPEDVLAIAPLAKRLRADDTTHDPLAAYWKPELDEQTTKDLAGWDPAQPVPEKLDQELRAVLNTALGDLGLYDTGRFPTAQLDEPTQALSGVRPLPVDLERMFNRWLLEQALPDVLAPTMRLVADWLPYFDLLESSGDDRAFVVEMTDDRRADLRFGDGDLGRRPEAVTRFRAFYRVGNGPRGNVGAEAIHLFALRSGSDPGLTLKPRNPLAATGGTDPESVAAVRLRAPYAIRRDLQRAVIADDYAALASRNFAAELQGAAAGLIWTGSWYAARVSPDPLGREEPAAGLQERLYADLEKYRRIGHELEVAPAFYVPLAIRLHVCVKPGYQTAHVLAALRETFGSRSLRGGGLGFFHPDNLRFGQGVAVSQLTAKAQAVAGVLWARVDQLERLGEGDQGEVAAGYLPIQPSEIARVDNDPGFPENGSIAFDMEGGR